MRFVAAFSCDRYQPMDGQAILARLPGFPTAHFPVGPRGRGEQTSVRSAMCRKGLRSGSHTEVSKRRKHRVEERLREAVGGPARLRVIVLLACVLALDSADKATVGATALQLERDLHIGNTAIGLLVTVSTAIGAVATLPAGALTDRANRTKLLTRCDSPLVDCDGRQRCGAVLSDVADHPTGSRRGDRHRRAGRRLTDR